MAGEYTEKREVHWLLAIGILFFPFIFVWFLARKGHSTLARGIGGTWTAVCLMVFLFSGSDPQPTPAYAESIPAPMAKETLAPVASPPVEVDPAYTSMQAPPEYAAVPQAPAQVAAAPAPVYQATQPSRQPSLGVTSMQLAQAYESNEVSAQMQYGNKTLHVSGIVTGITLDFMDNPVIEMQGVNQFLDVSAHFEKSYLSRISNVSKGQQITVVCAEISEVIGAPQLSKCSF